MADDRLLERLWFGDDAWARCARFALAPLEGVYRTAIRARGALFDARMLKSFDTVIPALSVGNVTVGGTGKTPVAAWIAGTLAERGARPAIVLRGYGEDEPLVHRMLNPGVPVIVAADRVEGVERAKQAGADVAVLDDAFQHRRARRRADFVLLSADRWTRAQHLLPAGPYREPLTAIRRATAVLITRKAASEEVVEQLSMAVRKVAPDVPQAGVRLAPRALREVGGDQRRPLDDLAGRPVHLLTAIGDPRALVRQLEAVGAEVTATIHPDHHDFSDPEIAAFARSIPSGAIAVCTLKDAVKLSDRWPRDGVPLWYVTQYVVVERSAEVVDGVLDEIMRAHPSSSPTAG